LSAQLCMFQMVDEIKEKRKSLDPVVAIPSITLTPTQLCISMPLSSWLTMTLEESNQSPLRVPRSELWALSYSDSTSPTYRHGTE
jgi:hypothetical protein